MAAGTAGTAGTQMDARAILERLVAFPTVSRDSNLDLVDWVSDYLAGFGVTARRVASPCGRKAHLFAQVGPDVPGGVILSGHTDVVPVEGQAWTTDPWRLTETDGRLYGRGTCDMKGFLALALAAVPRAQAARIRRPLQLAFSFDEELGCMAVVDLVEAMLGSLPRAGAVIVGEPSMMRVVTGHKGGAGFEVRLRGHEVHSSLLPQGVSAIMEAARLIDWANGCNAANAARVPGPLDAAFVPPFTTLHVGMIEGGTAHNITARDCRFVFEYRNVPGDTTDWEAAFRARVAEVEAGMKAIHPEAGISVTRGFAVPALVPETDGPAEALARRLTGDNGVHVVSYGTEGGQFQRRGLSTVVCGPGDIAQAHQPDEYVTLEQMAAGAAFLDRLVADLAA